MGRFYRTAGARPVDYMYRMNTPLMEKVLMTNEKGISDTLTPLETTFEFDHINTPEEEERYNKVVSDVNNKTAGFANTIRNDPANWRGVMPGIRKFKQDLSMSYNTGEISKMIGNYNKRKADFDAADKQTELYHTSGGEKGLNPTANALYKAEWDRDFTQTGWNPDKPGGYNIYRGGSAMDDINIKKRLSEGIDKINPDKDSVITTTPDGRYWILNKITNEKEEVSTERVLQAAMSNLTPVELNYLKERQRIGEIGGVYDEKADKFNEPFSYDHYGASEDETAGLESLRSKLSKTDKNKNPKEWERLSSQLGEAEAYIRDRTRLNWGNNSVITPILQGLVGTYAYTNTKHAEEATNWSQPGTIYGQQQANSRNAANINAANTRHEATLAQQDAHWKEQVAHVKRQDTETNRHNVAMENRTTGTGAGTGLKAKTGLKDGVKTDGTKVESRVTAPSEVTTHSFADWKVTNNRTGEKNIPFWSNEGMSTAITNTKDEVSGLETTLADLNTKLENTANPTVRGVLQNKILDATTQLDKSKKNLENYRSYYKEGIDRVKRGDPMSGVDLTPDQVKTYESFDNDRDATKFQGQISTKRNKLAALDNQIKNNTHAVRVIESETARKERIKNNADLSRQRDDLNRDISKDENRLKDYKSIHNTMNTGRENIFRKQAEGDVITSDAIQVGTDKKSQDHAYNTIFNSSNNAKLRVFGEDGKEGTDKTFWANGKLYHMSFAGDNNLKDYIRDNNIKVDVMDVGMSTNAGTGNAIAKVMIPGLGQSGGETGLERDTPIYISLTPEQQRDFGVKYSNHANREVSNTALSFLDTEANDIRGQLIAPKGKTSGIDHLPLHLQNEKGDPVMLNVTRDNEDNTLNITDGANNPFPRWIIGRDGRPKVDVNEDGRPKNPGNFRSPEDFMYNLRLYKAYKKLNP